MVRVRFVPFVSVAFLKAPVCAKTVKTGEATDVQHSKPPFEAWLRAAITELDGSVVEDEIQAVMARCGGRPYLRECAVFIIRSVAKHKGITLKDGGSQFML
jgi:hypothetical protein